MIDDWRESAACRGMNPDVFFPVDGNDLPARAVCRRCPVIAACDAYAEAIVVDDGVWGGILRGGRRRGQRTDAGCDTCGAPVDGGLVRPGGRWCTIECYRAGSARAG